MSSLSNKLTLRGSEQELAAVLSELDSGEPQRPIAFELLRPQPDLDSDAAHEWRLAHWGTTHTPEVANFEHEFEERPASEGERVLLFTTEGGPMLPLLAFLAASHPELEIELLYQDFSSGVAGRGFFAHGRAVTAWETHHQAEARAFLREHWPDAYEEWSFYDDDSDQ